MRVALDRAHFRTRENAHVASLLSRANFNKGGDDMRRKLIALGTAAALALTVTTALPQKAEARDGWWIAGAVVGGLALGAIAANAYYGPGPYYYYGGYYPYGYYAGYYPHYYGYGYYHRHYAYHPYYHRHYYAYYPYYHHHYRHWH
jgi:hypothetical protein